MTNQDDMRETKLPQPLYIDGLPYTTVEQIERRRQRLADLGLPDDTQTASPIKPEKGGITAAAGNERGDIMG